MKSMEEYQDVGAPAPLKKPRFGGEESDAITEWRGNSPEPEERVWSDGESVEEEDVQAQVDRFFADLDIEHNRQKKSLLSNITGGKVSRAYLLSVSMTMSDIITPQASRRRSILPPHLHSVMGSANLRLARGDQAGAIELCMEVIRQGRRKRG